jgi:hypothetical protein
LRASIELVEALKDYLDDALVAATNDVEAVAVLLLALELHLGQGGPDFDRKRGRLLVL